MGVRDAPAFPPGWILLKLNIGCGDLYRPGYVNVDPSSNSIADENWDIFDLPVKDGSVDQIVADHVLEFYDLMNARYILAEFWRVLRPNGELILETPDLMAIFKRLKKAKGDQFHAISGELFGEKSDRHGIVFKDSELEALLISSGFGVENMYSLEGKGGGTDLKVICKKGRSEGRRKVEVLYRKRIRKVFKGEPYMLALIERMINDLFFSLTVDGEPREPIFTENLFRAAVSDPEVPGQLLLAMKAYQKGRAMSGELMEALRFIHEEEVKSKAFTLWMKKNKGTDIRRSFEKFVSDLSENLRLNLSNLSNPRLELRYLISLDPTDIRMFEFDVIKEKAQRWMNLGIRSFSIGDMDEAHKYLEDSISALPNLAIAHWNLARIDYIRGDLKNSLKRFDKVLKNLEDRNLVREAKKEQELMRRGTLDREELGPIF